MKKNISSNAYSFGVSNSWWAYDEYDAFRAEKKIKPLIYLQSTKRI